MPCILICSGFSIVASPTRFWLGFSKIVEVSVSGFGVSASLGSSYHLPPLNLPVKKIPGEMNKSVQDTNPVLHSNSVSKNNNRWLAGPAVH